MANYHRIDLMPDMPRFSHQLPPVLQPRINELQADLRNLDPEHLTRVTGCKFISLEGKVGYFKVPLWMKEFHLGYPDFSLRDAISLEEPRLALQAIVLYYFQTADGTPLSNRWISFSELPHGNFYHRAFQGYTGNLLARKMSQLKVFEQSAAQIGGQRVEFGGAAYAFQVLPRVHLLTVLWEGDEEIPSSYQILFNEACPHYLPLEACAIAGSMLTHQLIANLKAR